MGSKTVSGPLQRLRATAVLATTALYTAVVAGAVHTMLAYDDVESYDRDPLLADWFSQAWIYLAVMTVCYIFTNMYVFILVIYDKQTVVQAVVV